jgi:hypothetical protein
MYRDIQEEGSIILEVIVSDIVRKDIHMNMRLILKVTETELFESKYKSILNGNKDREITYC